MFYMVGSSKIASIEYSIYNLETRRKNQMKKILLLGISALMLVGCGGSSKVTEITKEKYAEKLEKLPKEIDYEGSYKNATATYVRKDNDGEETGTIKFVYNAKTKEYEFGLDEIDEYRYMIQAYVGETAKEWFDWFNDPDIEEIYPGLELKFYSDLTLVDSTVEEWEDDETGDKGKDTEVETFKYNSDGILVKYEDNYVSEYVEDGTSYTETGSVVYEFTYSK